jgi:hypothetical protein
MTEVMGRLFADEKILAALIALTGVLLVASLNFYWSFRNAAESRRQPFLKAQLDACLGAARAVGGIIASEDQATRSTHETAFWALYWGELAVVEDRDVETAMVTFGRLLTRLRAVPDDEELWTDLRLCALDFTKAARSMILKSWHVRMPELDSRAVADFSIVGLDCSAATNRKSG